MLRQAELQFIEDKAGKVCPVCMKDVVGPGKRVYCSKECRETSQKKKQAGYSKKYYKENSKKIRERARKWKEDNPDKHRAHSRKSVRKYYKANPEKVKKANKKWQKANPEKCKEYCHRRRARLKGNGIEDTSDYRARMTHPLVRQVCFYCGKDCTSSGEWHWDHRIPISAGGPDAEWNLVIACVSCNLKKGSKYPKTLFAEEIFKEP